MLTKNTRELFQQVREHLAADAVVQEVYWQDGKGCFIGCLAHSPDAAVLRDQYGIPLPLVRVSEKIFEALTPAEARQFFADIPVAIGCDGKDLSLVVWQFLEETLCALPVQLPEVKAVIDGISRLAQGREWTGAAEAADAAWAAASAADAADAADAANAAWAAAFVADAALAADADADESAEAANAAWAADASTAENRRQRDSVLRLIAAAPINPTPTEPPTDD